MIEMHREKQNKNIPHNERYKKFSKKEETVKDKLEQNEADNVLGRALYKREPLKDTVQQQQDLFNGLCLSPHEFLSLVCNAKSHLEVLSTSFIPNFNLTKRQFVLRNDQFHLYELSNEELSGKPRHILNKRMEDLYYDFLPQKDMGQALSNKEAGIKPSADARDGKRLSQ